MLSNCTLQHKDATLNVGCMGKFFITVCEDGFWEVRFESKDGETYYRSRGSMIPKDVMIDMRSMITIKLPEFVWEGINAKTDELMISLERDALDTPEIKNTIV